jgi:integrase
MTNRWRLGESPARWRGHLEHVLPKRSKVAPIVHHAALPRKEIGDFMPKLTAERGTAAMGLRFSILTVARAGEVRFARWPEINMKGALWTGPPERMKAGREHRVPLSHDAIAILEEMTKVSTDPHGYIFPGRNPESLVNYASLKTLVGCRMMRQPDVRRGAWRDTSSTRTFLNPERHLDTPATEAPQADLFGL